MATMAKKKQTLYALACSKCGFVFNEYTASTRRKNLQLRLKDEGELIKDHDAIVHESDGEFFAVDKIHFKTTIVSE